MDESKSKKEVIVGFFILLGLIFLVSGILIVGNLSGTFKRKFNVVTLFNDVSGLQVGNNVWFSGVKVGVINDLTFYSQSRVKVVMKIEEKAQSYIRKNARVKLSSEGIIGNKILIIDGGTPRSPQIEEGDTLKSEETFSSDDMINTLQDNNKNLLAITSDFKEISNSLMNGEGTIGKLLTDEDLYVYLKEATKSLQTASYQAQQLIRSMAKFSEGLNKEGTLAYELTNDTLAFKSIKASLLQFENITDSASVVINRLKEAAVNKNTPAGVLIHDTESGAMLKRTLGNLESSSVKLNENLEALQHNFLFRGYFKRIEREKSKTAEQ